MPEKTTLKLDWATYEAAKYACEHWHYSRCIPKSKLVKIGVWEDDAFKGVVIFGVGANSNLVKQYGLEANEGCELVRIALREHKSFVSEIMSSAIRKLRETNPKLKMIVSFADPEQGHLGKIYQATNWIYTGQSLATDEYIVNGRRLQGRSARNGKPKNLTTKEYLKRIDPNFQVVKGSSKYRYLMPLNKKMRKICLKYAKPYPTNEVANV